MKKTCLKKLMRDPYLLKRTVSALIKTKNPNNTFCIPSGNVVFNTWLYGDKNMKTNTLSSLFSTNISVKKNTILNYAYPKKFHGQLLNHKKNLLVVPSMKEDKKKANKNFPFFNRSFDKKRLKMLFSWYYANRGEAATFSLVETLQKLGFTYAMKAGISLGVDDLKVPAIKGESLTEAVELLRNTKTSVNSGNVTALEEFQQFVDTWHRTSENLKTSVVQNFSSRFFSLNLKAIEKTNKNNLIFSSEITANSKTLLDHSNIKTKEIIKKGKAVDKDQDQAKQSLGRALHSNALSISKGPSNLYFSEENQEDKNKKSLFGIHSKPNSVPKEHLKYKEKKAGTKAFYSTILNPVYMMAFSGARGNLSQVRQLVGMRGLMADPQGQLVEFPIQSNFREGLTVTEYMISCYGARKGLVDTALRTAAAGYLTRRLVDVSHHQIVRFVTCGTKGGILLSKEHNKKENNRDNKNQIPSAWKVSPDYSEYKNPDENKKDSLKTQSRVSTIDTRIPSRTDLLHKIKISKFKNPDEKEKTKANPLIFCVGRVLARDIPGIAFRNQEIDISLASSPLLRKVYDTVGLYIRSPLTCKSETGICQLCYGWSVSANRLVGLGEAVGIIAAQSIGEPGTQLTMRTFHTGGVFSGDIMEECRAKHAGVVFFQNVYLGLLVRTAGGAIAFCLKTSAIFQIKGTNETTTYTVSPNTLLFVRQGEQVLMDSLLAQIPNLPTVEESTGEATKTILSDLSGEVRQKATVNPELASIRILAGQKCRQFYFFNSFGPLPEKNKSNSICFFNLILGSHRLGNNQTFSININGLNSEVVLPKPSSSYKKSFLSSNKTFQRIKNKSIFSNTNFFSREVNQEHVMVSKSSARSYLELDAVAGPKNRDYNPVGEQKLTMSMDHSKQKQRLKTKANSFDTSYFDSRSEVVYRTLAKNIRKIQENKKSKLHFNDKGHEKRQGETTNRKFKKLNIRTNAGNLCESVLLRNLRFFVASKIHQNKQSHAFYGLGLRPSITLVSDVSTFVFKNKKQGYSLPWSMAFRPTESLPFEPSTVVDVKQGAVLPPPSAIVREEKLGFASTNKTSNFNNALLFVQRPSKQKNQSKKPFLKNAFKFGIYKIKTFLQEKGNIASFSLASPNFMAISTRIASTTLPSITTSKIKIEKKTTTRISNQKLKEQERKPLKFFFFKTQQKRQFSKTQQFISFASHKNTNKTNKKISALKQLSTLTVWPKSRSNMLDIAYLFWKLEDLLFFYGNFKASQLRIYINNCWCWSQGPGKSSNHLNVNNKTKNSFDISYPEGTSKLANKGIKLIKLKEKKIKYKCIREFPNLILKLEKTNIRTNSEKCLNSFQTFQDKTQKEKDQETTKLSKGTNFSSLSFNEFYTKTKQTKKTKTFFISRKFKFQDSGEIFPLQGQTNLKDFQKKFCSFQTLRVKDQNSGLLTHYNRISYKVPLCAVVKKTNKLSSSDLQTNNPILIKEQLSRYRPELASFTTSFKVYQKQSKEKEKLNNSKTLIVKHTLIPQIGDFINSGDELIKECASAYCGQIIEKSTLGLTLRLTQNILYSNLRNRPAKINKNVNNGYWIGKGDPLVTLPYISNVTGDIVAGIPKIEQLFEARGEALDDTVEKIWTSMKLSIVPRAKAVRECFKEIGLFVVAAIQKVYSSQGVHIADKHLEVIIRQMTRRALIVDPGDTEFLPEEFVDLNTIECVNWQTYGDNAIYRPKLIGITKASLTSNSFLSSASFQQTARVLERETVLEKTDRLLGLKERVMMGALINAGTGELKTSVRLSDRSLAKSLSNKLFQRLSFFSRRKTKQRINKKTNF